MKRRSTAEKLLLEEISNAGKNLQKIVRGLAIGDLIKLHRTQLGMSQKTLSERSGVPQSTISKIEQNQRDFTLSTLQKIIDALSCDILITPILKQPIDTLRRKQARKIAERHVRYLRGTMSLEKQEPDQRLLEELIKSEEDEILRSSGTKLWEENE